MHNRIMPIGLVLTFNAAPSFPWSPRKIKTLDLKMWLINRWRTLVAWIARADGVIAVSLIQRSVYSLNSKRRGCQCKKTRAPHLGLGLLSIESPLRIPFIYIEGLSLINAQLNGVERRARAKKGFNGAKRFGYLMLLGVNTVSFIALASLYSGSIHGIRGVMASLFVYRL